MESYLEALELLELHLKDSSNFYTLYSLGISLLFFRCVCVSSCDHRCMNLCMCVEVRDQPLLSLHKCCLPFIFEKGSLIGRRLVMKARLHVL